ncbi:hypothetical protein [Oscillibacter sp.]|uniref:hypothetical protein n=1 Tax=Oscillibacter sp. TaxID=1945593 RepID=UPI00289EEC6D|nr:hypothetical protein [Oscillibacter sp.]
MEKLEALGSTKNAVPLRLEQDRIKRSSNSGVKRFAELAPAGAMQRKFDFS